MRRLPPPLSVIRPPPSSTTVELVFRTLAVAVIVIVTGAGPQSKTMTPPRSTAFTTAAEVQPAGVPFPTVRSGLLVSTARASAGIVARPAGFPALGTVLVAVGRGEGDATAGADRPGTAEAGTAWRPLGAGSTRTGVLAASSAQPPSVATPIRAAVSIASSRLSTGRL